MTPGPRRATRVLGACLLLAGLSGCEGINWPFHHHDEPPPPQVGNDLDADAACQNLLAQIRQSQQDRRVAAATSTDPDIVSAAQGKADQRIEELRRHYDELDCPASDVNATTRPHREPPLQPAPGVSSH